MPDAARPSRLFSADGVVIDCFIEGVGPPFVILPSYGRDGGADFDDLAARLVAAGWQVLRPQPRGIAGSAGPMAGLSLHDLASDVAGVLRALGAGPAVVLGHAYGNLVTRMLATDHPTLVKAVILAAAQASHVDPEVAKTPFIAGDAAAPEEIRLAALAKGFFAPGHDPRIWLDGWYPETLDMQRVALTRVARTDYWASGTVPLLEVIAEHDAFKPKASWPEMRDQFGARITTEIVPGAAHALFPEQPDAVAKVVLTWAEHFRS